MALHVKNTFIHISTGVADTDDVGQVKRSTSLPPTTRFYSSPRAAEFNSPESTCRYSREEMPVKKNGVHAGKSPMVEASKAYVPRLSMESPIVVPDRTELYTFTEDISTDASDGDDSSEAGKSTLAEEILQIEQSLQDVNNALLEIQSSMLRCEPSRPLIKDSSFQPIASAPQKNARGTPCDLNVMDPREALIRPLTETSKRTSTAWNPNMCGLERFQTPVEFTLVVMRTQLLLSNYLGQASVEVVEQSYCWLISVRVWPQWQEQAAAFAKEALLKASDETNGIEILGSHTEPFAATPSGFVATLAFVPDKYNACWGMLQKGCCSFGKRCRWQHPVHQRKIYVEVSGLDW